jgi:hypothetical protein
MAGRCVMAHTSRDTDSDLPAQTPANAALIAAAPEMLAALKVCVEPYAWMDDDVTPPRILLARAVIAKAEAA